MERDDEFVREEEEAAAAEARAIGGSPGEDPFEGDPDRFDRDRDPAFRAVDEAGGGDAEGFEQAESLLEEHATEPRHPSPFVDAERIDEEAAALDTSDDYGEADQFQSSELREDQLGPADDQPGTGADDA